MKQEQLILHHYDASPYAEKIRLMFGKTNTSWYSVLSPSVPPRPNVDPLAGGYRRIPIAQVGADIFCDTALISDEIAAMTGAADVAPSSVPEAMVKLVARAEGELFFAAIGSAPPLKLLLRLTSMMGPFGVLRFIKDRQGMMKGGTVRPAQGAAARELVEHFLVELDQALEDREWLNGDQVGYADFAVYHPLWLKALAAGTGIDLKFNNAFAWNKRVSEVGHGTREELAPADCFAIARDAAPRALPESDESALPMESRVSVAPADYGRDPVLGSLVAFTEERIIVARETDVAGRVHVHFPRNGYEVKPV